jgi:hypothetical protein
MWLTASAVVVMFHKIWVFTRHCFLVYGQRFGIACLSHLGEKTLNMGQTSGPETLVSYQKRRRVKTQKILCSMINKFHCGVNWELKVGWCCVLGVRLMDCRNWLGTKMKYYLYTVRHSSLTSCEGNYLNVFQNVHFSFKYMVLQHLFF